MKIDIKENGDQVITISKRELFTRLAIGVPLGILAWVATKAARFFKRPEQE